MSPLLQKASCARHGSLLLLMTGLFSLAGCEVGGIKAGETVVFFPTVAHRAPDGNWVVPVSGWISEPRFSDHDLIKISHFVKLYEFAPEPEKQAMLRERIHPFLAENKSARCIEVVIAGRHVRLTKSTEDGLFDDLITVPAGEISTGTRQSTLQTDWITYHTLPNRKGEFFEGGAKLLEPTGLSVISDIDDTIRITDVNNTKKMIKNTFIEKYEVVPGMAEVYANWARVSGAKFHYVSASAYELQAPLSKFITDTYPDGSLYLRPVKYDGNVLKYFMELLDAPVDYKVERIESILRDFPQREFVMVGDSGQNDPEVYAQLARNYPKQVRLIFIRDVTCEDADAERYQKVFGGLPRSLWRIFRNPGDIRDLPKMQEPKALSMAPCTLSQ